MSVRTKGFFEQDNRTKPRPGQWHRHQNRPALGEINSNAATVKPPVPPTAQAKAKLQAFQFTAEAPQEVQCAGERMPAIIPTDEARRAQWESAANTELALEEKIPEPVSLEDEDSAEVFPSTPSMRLPLEDLIGNFDATKRAEPQNQSPEEYIGWIPNSSSTLLTPNRKRRKRARSSSPSCPSTSQRHEGVASFASVGAQADKSTPETDPAAALWQRYGAKQADGEYQVPDFSHLMSQESPQMLETPLKCTGLRRWASTGNDWPSCKNKRRKLATANSIDMWQEQQYTGGISKVAAMVDSIQQSLATQKLANPKTKPREKHEGPSSSSPLPTTGAGHSSSRVPIASPLGAKQRGAAPTKERHADPPSPRVPVSTTMRSGAYINVAESTSLAPAGASGSESLMSAPLHLQSKAPLPAYKRPCLGRQNSGGGVQYPQRIIPPTKPSTSAPEAALAEDLEEFGADLDLSAEDLDELLENPPPLHERPLHQIPAHPNPPPQNDLSNLYEYDMGNKDVDNSLPALLEGDEDDEFGCDDIDEDAFAQAEISATQGLGISTNNGNLRKRLSPPRILESLRSKQVLDPARTGHLQRFIVKQVVDGEYTNSRGSRCSEKLLVGEDERSCKTFAITLRESWAATIVSVGNIIHLAHIDPLANKESRHSNPQGQIIVSDSDTSPMIIVHPDHMLSATTIADSFDCSRKAVLQDRIKATGDTNKAMIYGKILHEIVQQALSANQWDDRFLSNLVDQTVCNHLEGLWELGMRDTVLAMEEVRGKMGELAAWARIFVNEKHSEVSLVDDRNGAKVWMTISKLIAIEEHIWSPKFGLKGNIDATIQATLLDHPDKASKKLVMPFEVKTGRAPNSPAHRAQTALYTLLLSNRYDVAVKSGILYYLESSAMSRIAPPLIEIRQMLQQRNRLASYIYRARHPGKDTESTSSVHHSAEVGESALPPMLKNPFKCGRCYARQSCLTYHATVENGSASSAGMIDDGKKNHALVWQEAVGHLRLGAKDQSEGDALKRWFTKWERLLTFEERDMSRLSREIWTMSSTEREAAGRCFGNLVISVDSSLPSTTESSTTVDGIQGSGGKISRFTYQFVRSPGSGDSPFTEGTQLVVGEPIVISSEEGQWALANGYIVALSKHKITVAVDRKLSGARERLPGFDDSTNQCFRGIMDVTGHSTAATVHGSKQLYRLDKDEFSNGLAVIRNNLVTLMSPHPIPTKLRSQIVLNTAPKFSSSKDTFALPPSQLGDMNADQRAAITKVLSADDYALILGMPGTGKTTTIAHLIRALLAEGKSILLTSFTHTAVDNILLKIRDIAPPNSILRLGVPAKINAEVQTFCQLAATPRTTIEEIDQAFMETKIVATTCMGTNHALFNRRAFDVCIVDEASQITLPTSLGPLLHARKFVLVGDHYQLPPLVQNRAALEGGLDISLFRQLSEEHPHAVSALGEQYRMCEEIMSLSNTLVYNGQLRCGSETVARRTLHVSDMSALSTFHSGTSLCSWSEPEMPCWLRQLTAPENKVIYANTDGGKENALETLTASKNITNRFEAMLSVQLVLALLAIGVPGRDIGIMTLYRSQLALIRQLFKRAGISRDVEIDSADRFQGRDKECIILSMVRSNEAGVVGDLLKDWRRINVALTRARSKLIVLGSRRTLRNNELLAQFLALVDDKGWAMDLTKDALEMHTFPSSSPATSSLTFESPQRQTATKAAFASSPASSLRSPSRILRPSQSAGNRNNSNVGHSGRQAAKVIKGTGGLKARKAKEQIAMEIFEDLTADDL